MKKRKILLGALLATTAIFGIASCDGPDPDADKIEDNGGSGEPQGEVTKYTVTFDSKGGSTVASQEVDEGGKATQPTAPTKTETAQYTFTFAGWYKDSACTQAFNFASDTITANTTLYAKWTENVKSYTVTFNSNGGTAVAAATVNYGSTVSRPNDPSKEGTADTKYAFGGWYKDAALTQAYDFSSQVTGAFTLYAKWTETDKFTVQFNTGEGTHVDSQLVFEGETATRPTTDPTREATATKKFTFGGWYADETCQTEFDFSTAITQATTVYAKWVETNLYAVTFESNGGTAITAQTVEDGQKLAAFTAPTKEATQTIRYTFAGWYTTSTFEEGSEFDVANDTVTEAMTLYAKWTETNITYNVLFKDGSTVLDHVSVNALSTVDRPAEDPTKTIDDDTKVIKFDDWYKDAALTQKFDFATETITGTTSIYAKFDTYNKINNVEEFNAFRALEASNENFILTADIDLEGVTLESTAVVFTGKFNGDGHSIKNGMYVENAANKTGLLVKELNGGGVVTNVKFVSCVSRLNGETIAIIAGMSVGTVNVSKVEFNGCSVSCNNYAGFIIGRTNSSKAEVTFSEITCKNGCKSTVTSYGGTLIGDVAAGEATKHVVLNIFDCDLSIELAGANKNGGFLSGRLRGYTDFTVKNVVIRSAIIQENSSGSAGLICGGGDNNAANSNLVVENLYIMSTNSKLLQSCALQTGSNPVTTFTLSYTNCYMASDALANITDNTINGNTLLQGVDKSTADINWLQETLKLDFNDVWTAEPMDATAYRLAVASTNVKSPDAVIERLKLSTANATLRFEEGTDFSADGLAVTGIYSDGVNLVLNAGVDFEVISTDYDKNTAGTYTITVKSLENETVVATYEVEVVSLVSYDVDTEFTKITYVPGEELNLSGLLVYGTWTDGKRLLFKDYTLNDKSLGTVVVLDETKGTYKVILPSTASVLNLEVSVEGFASTTVEISVVGTRPVVTDNYTYINVDASAVLAFGGERVDGTETFNTINEAIEYYASLKLDASVNKVIYIADGTYHEKITVPASLKNLKIIGESREGTIIEYDAVEDTVNPLDGSKYVMNCATLHINAENFGLENITVRNSFDYINDNTKYGNPQGFALTIAADGAVINEVTLYGNQDTLFFKKGRVYLKDSEIDGNIDFIFGENDGIAFFDNCVIKAINKSTTQQNNNGYVTAMKGDATNHPTYGYVFNSCTFTDDGTLKEGSMSLGRPWGPGATVTMINCEFSAAYSTLGYDGSTKSRWFDMSGNKPMNANFAEYGSTGEGRIEEAVNGGSILTADEALNYTAANTFAAENGGVKWGSAFNYLAAYNALVAAKNKVEATGILVYLDGAAIDDTMTIAKDDTSTLILTSTEWNAEDKDVQVSFEDDSFASYADGKIQGLATGETTVTFTLGAVTKTVTLTIIELPSYDITFVVPEGASAVATQSIKKNKKVVEPTAPTLTGSVFKGWFTDDSYTEAYDFDTIVLGEVTLYARFVAWEDMYKENIVVYMNNTVGDGIDTFTFVGKNGANSDPNFADSCGIVHTAKIQARDSSKNDTQFNKNNDASFAVEKYATIIITYRSLNGANVTYKLGDETITPTVSADGLTFTYETTKAGVFHMINDNTANAYLSSISVTYPEVITKTTRIDFGTNGDYKTATVLDQSAATYGQIQGACNQIMKDSVLVLYVNPQATIHISGNWSVGYDINGEQVLTSNAGGTDNTGLEHDYYCENGGKVVITSLHNNNYFYYISVSYPAKIENDLVISFATGGNGYGMIDGVAMACTVTDHGGDGSAQVKNGTITLSLKAAATITIDANWGLDVIVGDTVVKNTNAGGDYNGTTYTCTAEAGDLVITMGSSGSNYLKTITIEY